MNGAPGIVELLGGNAVRMSSAVIRVLDTWMGYFLVTSIDLIPASECVRISTFWMTANHTFDGYLDPPRSVTGVTLRAVLKLYYQSASNYLETGDREFSLDPDFLAVWPCLSG